MKCDKCEFEIDERNDKWVRITNFDSGDEGRTIYLHLECWKDKEKIAIQKAFEEKVQQISPMLKKIMQKIGVTNEQQK